MEHFEKALERARGGKLVKKQTTEPSLSAPDQSATVPPAHQFPAPSVPDSSALLALKFKDPVADLFRLLRTQVVKGLANRKGTMLGICSARAGEGKTFIAANLAASIALSQENTVLLLDLDLRRPGVYKHFKLEPRPGITDILAGTAKLSDSLREVAVPGLQVLLAGAPIQNSSEALGSSDLAKAVNELRQASPSRIIVCDLPPLLSSDDALMFSSKVDAILFVVEEGRTRPGELQRSLELLGASNVLGTVLNKSRYNNPYPYSHYEMSTA